MGKDLTKINTNNIKAFFFDNDSTVFNHSGIGKEILDSTYEGIKKLKDKGYKVCMITSRGYEEMYNVSKDFLELFDDVCLLSGGYIMSKDGIEMKAIDQDVVRKIIDKIDTMDVTYRYATKDGGGYLNRHDESKESIFKELYDMVPGIKKYDNEEVLHLLIYFDKEKADKLHEEIKDVEYSHVGTCAEIGALGVDKGLTLEKMAKKYGLDLSQTCAFGDSGNDVSMFNKAGLAICLGNGKDDAKEASDYITGNVWEDGLYNALKHFKFID